MICKKCKKSIPDDALFCCYCGKNLQPQFPKAKKRANGDGSVAKIGANNYKAIVVVGYKNGDASKPIRKTKSGFKTKAEALAYIPKLKSEPKVSKTVTFSECFDAWIVTQDFADSTRGNYNQATKWLEPLMQRKMDSITLQEVQEIVSRTDICQSRKTVLRNVIRSMWRYAIPRKWVTSEINIGEYLEIGKPKKKKPKQGFSPVDFEKIRDAVGTVPFADVIYILCLTGFRISELLSLKHNSYDPELQTLTGGIKTEAGKNRIVTVSPKILPFIEERYNSGSEYLFISEYGTPLKETDFRTRFASCLSILHIDAKAKGYTPHTCRHTFADLLKNVDGADRDKLELMGHKDTSMLLYYQSSSLEDLRRITNAI